MNFITKKHLDRRTFLRGLGATLALPLLDSMVPALAETTACFGSWRLRSSAASCRSIIT